MAMKIHTISRKEFDQAAIGKRIAGYSPYTDVYKALAELKIGQGLKLTFDTEEEARKCKQTVAVKINSKSMNMETKFSAFTDGCSVYFAAKERNLNDDAQKQEK